MTPGGSLRETTGQSCSGGEGVTAMKTLKIDIAGYIG